MVQELRKGNLDFAVGLTEGFVNALAKEQQPFRLVGTYVLSPLVWSISTALGSNSSGSIDSFERLSENPTIGISRFGSGSHIMSFLLAQREHWNTEKLKFVELTNLSGLTEGTITQKCSAFLWELYTMKPFYSTSGGLQTVGTIDTPWPSWVIAGANTNKPDITKRVLDAIQEGVAIFKSKSKDEVVSYILANVENYQKNDVENWYDRVQFADNTTGVDSTTINNVINILKEADVIKENEGNDIHDIIA